MFIIAHRGNTSGRTVLENNIDYLLDTAQLGFGLEIDIRRAVDTGDLIISHDPESYDLELDAELILKELRDTFIALNIKQPGLLPDIRRIKPELNGFVFDFELCCPDPEEEIRSYQSAGYKIARRLSDRGEVPSGDFDYLWIDEMDQTGSLDLSQVDLTKAIYVSPELHGRNILESRIEEFWAVCTDYADFYSQTPVS